MAQEYKHYERSVMLIMPPAVCWSLQNVNKQKHKSQLHPTCDASGRLSNVYSDKLINYASLSVYKHTHAHTHTHVRCAAQQRKTKTENCIESKTSLYWSIYRKQWDDH